MRQQIENTEAFKGFDKWKQTLWSKNANVKKLKEQLIIARQQGYESWKAIHKPCDSEDKIIKELLSN